MNLIRQTGLNLFNLLYNNLKLVGTKKAVAIAIKNNKPQKRYTLLKDRLMKLMDFKVSKREIEANEQAR